MRVGGRRRCRAAVRALLCCLAGSQYRCCRVSPACPNGITVPGSQPGRCRRRLQVAEVPDSCAALLPRAGAHRYPRAWSLLDEWDEAAGRAVFSQEEREWLLGRTAMELLPGAWS